MKQLKLLIAFLALFSVVVWAGIKRKFARAKCISRADRLARFRSSERESAIYCCRRLIFWFPISYFRKATASSVWV